MYYACQMSAERSKRETFASFVRPRTIVLGGFDCWETSSVVRRIDGGFNIYSGFAPSLEDRRRGLHIVVGEKRQGSESTWYFGTFRGPSWTNMTAEECEKCSQRELDFLKDKYRVPGGKLESLIQEAALFLP